MDSMYIIVRQIIQSKPLDKMNFNEHIKSNPILKSIATNINESETQSNHYNLIKS